MKGYQMKDLQYRLLNLSMSARDFSQLFWHEIGGVVIMTTPGYSLKQCMRWKYPVITRRSGPVFYEHSNKDAYYGGHSYQLFGDINDVAGISQLVADRAEA
jgi:hypothetical protein